jgi:hypothetical protein
MKRGNDRRYVVVGAGVVVAKEPNGQGNDQVVVEETRKEGVCLVAVQRLLLGPVNVVLGEPEEVVVAYVYACAK